MKIRLLALTVAVALLLSGCASMLRRSYSSAGAHVDYTLTEDQSILRAESYRGLVDAMLYFVGEHVSSGTIRLYNYTRPVEIDLASARQEVLEQTPLGAFAVSDITCQFSRIVSYYEVEVSISYSRSAAEIQAIRSAVGGTAIRQELSRAMAEFQRELTLRVSYFSGDEQALLAHALRAYYDTPLAAFGLPSLSVALYPSVGTQRIAHFTLQWPDSDTPLPQRSEELRSHARQLLAQTPSAGEQHTLDELVAIMAQVYVHDPAGADDPHSALSGRPATLQGWALGLELLCQLAQMESTLVSGARDGLAEYWLIVAHEGGYRHLAFTGEGAALYTDDEMTALGCSWNYDGYPRCESGPTGEEAGQ